MKWLIQMYRVKQHIKSDTELAKRTGIKRQHFYTLMNQPERIRLSELRMLDEILKFSDEDLLKIIRGEL